MMSDSKGTNHIKIGNNYLLFPSIKLGSGAFGTIYSGLNIISKAKVAIKTESVSSNHPQLKNEAEILNFLQGGEGLPHCLYYESGQEYPNVMVMDFLGLSLEAILSKSKKCFTLKTILLLADQMLNRLEYIHTRHIIHRDIKPDNFLMGINREASKVYLIDFGLAKRFRNPKTGNHIPYIDGKSLTGTARYSSIYTHLGIEQSRRDDLESLGYTLLYLKNGKLPWHGLYSKTKQEKYQKILEKKMNLSLELLCTGLPDNFQKFIQYTRNLQFEEKPNYDYLKGLFIEVYNKYNYDYDGKLEWSPMTHKEEDGDIDDNDSNDYNENNEKIPGEKCNRIVYKDNKQSLKGNSNMNINNQVNPNRNGDMMFLDYNDVFSLKSMNEEEVFDC